MQAYRRIAYMGLYFEQYGHAQKLLGIWSCIAFCATLCTVAGWGVNHVLHQYTVGWFISVAALTVNLAASLARLQYTNEAKEIISQFVTVSALPGLFTEASSRVWWAKRLIWGMLPWIFCAWALVKWPQF